MVNDLEITKCTGRLGCYSGMQGLGCEVGFLKGIISNILASSDQGVPIFLRKLACPKLWRDAVAMLLLRDLHMDTVNIHNEGF